MNVVREINVRTVEERDKNYGVLSVDAFYAAGATTVPLGVFAGQAIPFNAYAMSEIGVLIFVPAVDVATVVDKLDYLSQLGAEADARRI